MDQLLDQARSIWEGEIVNTPLPQSPQPRAN